MTGPRGALATALLLVGGAVGCAGEPDPAGPSGSTAHRQEPSMAEFPTGMDAQVEAAVRKLAARLDVPAEQVEVVSADTVTWGDTSLGCPQPGMRYAQVVTDGVLILLAHHGVQYAFHAGGDRPDPFLCEQPPGTGPGPSPVERR